MPPEDERTDVPASEKADMPEADGLYVPTESDAPELKASADDLVAAEELPPVAVKMIAPFLPTLAEEGLSSRLQPVERRPRETKKMKTARAEVLNDERIGVLNDEKVEVLKAARAEERNFPEKGKAPDVRERTC